MRPVNRRSVIRLFGAAAVAATSTAAMPTRAGARLPDAWSVEKVPLSGGASRLVALTASSRTHAWAVGGQTTVGAAERSLTTRWDGRSWTVVPSPGDAVLNDVSGAGTADAWAVGSTDDATRSVIQRWNGTEWVLVDHVAASQESPLALGGVVRLGHDSAIAVGYRGDLLVATPHSQHWDGQRWSEQPVPRPARMASTVLPAVVAAQGAVWASGFSITPEFTFRPYLVRWNGAEWVPVTVPAHITGSFNDLVVSADRIVAVGSDLSPGGEPVPVVAAYRAGTWTRETVPVDTAELHAIDHDGRGNLLVAGDRIGPGGHDDRAPLLLRRQPLGWTVDRLPATDPAGLRHVAAVRGTSTVWAVGATGVTEQTHRALVLGHATTDPRD